MGLRADLERLGGERQGARKPPRRGLVWVVTFLTTFIVVSYLTRHWDVPQQVEVEKRDRQATAQRETGDAVDAGQDPVTKSAALPPSDTANSGTELKGIATANSQTPAPSADPGSHEARPPPLSQLGQQSWRSPAGLVYAPGSAEGHRLKHVARHLEDDGDRPVHGVFEGDLAQAIAVIDQAYQWHSAGDSRATSRKDRQRIVIEARFDRPIGYVGGEQGADEGFPKASRLRLVVEGDAVITAFPIR